MTSERIANAQQALQREGLDALLVTHAANIHYLTGLRASAGAALVTMQGCVLIVDFRYATAARAAASAESRLSVVIAEDSLDAAIAGLVGRSSVARLGVEAEHVALARFNRLASKLASEAPLPMDERKGTPVLVATERVIERLRAVKEPAEIETLREAGRRLSVVARNAPHWLAAGRTEIEVAADIDAALRTAGFERPAFETIVASGPNGALPHARPTSRRIGAGEGVVLDFGGVYDGYCVDLTRTLHIGPMPGQFRRLFEAVREAQAAAIAAVRPGVLPADIDGAARRVLERHGLGEAFGHGTGHGLGLEVHEEPRVSRHAPPGEPVVPGMVFTIEPGAYVPGIGGVRIEDDVLVTGDGCDMLTDVPIDFQGLAL